MKAVILAAGLGTRFKSEKPKVLHHILGKPMIWYVINAVRKGGIKDIAVVVGYKAEEVMETVGEEVNFYLQSNPKGGTAEAVLASIDFWRNEEDYLLVINGDSPLIKPETVKNMQRFLFMVEEYEKVKLGGVILTSFLSDPTGYGRVVKEEGTDRIVKIVEEKEASPEEKSIREVNGGVYMFYIPYLLEALFKIKPSEKTGELYLTDAVDYMVRKGYEIRSFQASEPTEILGVNTRWELSFAESIVKLKLIKYWAERGVTVHSPETVWIEPDVELEENVEIFPDVMLKGKTRIAKNTVIHKGSIIENSVIGENVNVYPFSYIKDSKVEKGAVVGPFSRIREQTVVGEKAEVGNFVEIKKSIISRGVKAKHLAYIGDAHVGKQVNISAGVVTANYDGKEKHKTFIGDNAFVGSNSLLIAPLSLGDFCYIAGGSVISKDIPSGALAIERSRLRILEGKGKKKLEK